MVLPGNLSVKRDLSGNLKEESRKLKNIFNKQDFLIELTSS
jgi:hypothetical protein